MVLGAAACCPLSSRCRGEVPVPRWRENGLEAHSGLGARPALMGAALREPSAGERVPETS